MLYEPKKDRGKDARSIWQLGPAQKRLAYYKDGAIGRPLFLHQEDGCTL